MQAEIKAGFLHFTVLSAREIQIPVSSPHKGSFSHSLSPKSWNLREEHIHLLQITKS